MRTSLFAFMLALYLILLQCTASGTEINDGSDVLPAADAQSSSVSVTPPQGSSSDLLAQSLVLPGTGGVSPDKPITTTSTAANAAPANSQPDASKSQLAEGTKEQDKLQGGAQNKTIQPPGVTQQEVDAIIPPGTGGPTEKGAPPSKPPPQPKTPPLQHQTLQLSTNHQPQQSHDQSHTISQGEVKLQGDAGNSLQNGRNAAPTSINKDAPQILPVVTQERTTDIPPTHHEPHAPGQPDPKEQPLTPSHPTKPGVQQTPERLPTITTNTDKTLGKYTGSVTRRTEKTPKDHNDAQVPPPPSTDDKTVLPGTNKTPMTTADKTPVSAQKPENLTPAAAGNAVDQKATITGNNNTHSAQTTTTSTAEPAKRVSAPPTNPSQKLSNSMLQLDNKDSSIGSSRLFVLASFTTVVVMFVAPAF